MTFIRIFGASWLVGTLLLAAWLITVGWRGEAPQLTELNAWLAVSLAVCLSAVGAVLPAALFSTAIWAAAKKKEQISFVQALTTRGRRSETNAATSGEREAS